MTAFIEAASPHVMNTYGRVPIALSHGQGCRVWDVNGKQYLDALGGIAVNTLGHNHAKLVPALQDQIGKIIHSSNYYHVPGQEQLAARLVEALFLLFQTQKIFMKEIVLLVTIEFLLA